jgi:hypothetical protein
MMAFKNAFIQAIARASSFKPGVALPLHLIRLYTYQIFSQTHGVEMSQWERAGRKPQGLDVKIQVLPLALSRTDGRNRRSTLLTQPGEDRGHWSLTSEGVQRARTLDNIRRGKAVPNLTAQWLGDQFNAPGGMGNSGLYKALEKSIASKCPVSAASSLVDDHIGEYITRLIHRDSLRNRIMTGRSITTSHLCSYAVRSAWSDARNSGTNPVCREIYGARTETERRNATSDRRWAINDSRVVLSRGEDGVSQRLDIAVNDHDMIEDAIYFEALWNRILDEVVAHRAGQRYLQVLKLKLSGHTMNDIALEMNISTSRVSSLIADARKVIKDARDEGALDKYLN